MKITKVRFREPVEVEEGVFLHEWNLLILPEMKMRREGDSLMIESKNDVCEVPVSNISYLRLEKPKTVVPKKKPIAKKAPAPKKPKQQPAKRAVGKAKGC